MDNSTEIMDSHRMEALILEMKTRYKDRYIIFNAPALSVCEDKNILGIILNDSGIRKGWTY
ncbi:MAG: hypothetical protein LWW98_07565 [Deltaproteobacteria bacterium]|nr:hypothetical protein [Deltaproteobacteria bacterium]